MMESMIERLKERGHAPDVGTAVAHFVTAFVLMFEAQRIPNFPYRKWHIRNRIQDSQANELKIAASKHKHVVFLYFFLCAATHAINCVLPKYQNERGIVLMRFLTKCCWSIVSYLILSKICDVLRSKPPLETTVKTRADHV